MLDVQKLIASVEECLGWPYVSPGTNDSRGIDCSGLFVKAYRDQGASIYHGSNTIYRKYCSEKGKLTNVSQLKPGMVVFKWNANTPEKFDDGLGDFQHIGLVTSVNPLRIVHTSSAAGCVTTDTKLGKWAYWGWLKDVAKGADPVSPSNDEGDEEPVGTRTAFVTADSGTTVNLRVRANTSAALVERVPIGSMVEILGTGNKWAKVHWGTKTGYMMNQFLTEETPAEEPEIPLTLEERVAALEKRVTALEGIG